MDTLFTVRHNRIGLIIRSVFFILFTLFASFILFQLTLGPFSIFPMKFRWLFIAVAIVFVVLGLTMCIRTLLMFLNPIIMTAGSRTIQYKNDSYAVDRIDRFVYTTHYERNRDGRYLKEILVIEGQDGALTMNIDFINMKTKELLDLFRTHYPMIEVVVLNRSRPMDEDLFEL